MEISVVIPVFNEEKNIPMLVERLLTTLKKITDKFEIIFVNDCSKDNSLTILKNLCARYPFIKYISFTRNFGHQIAVSCGLEYSCGDAVVIIDADLQDPPELILDMYEKYKLGFKVVYAKRIKREGETWFKKFSAKIFYRLMSKMVNFEIPLDTGDFRIIDKQVVEDLNKMTEKIKYLRGQIAWLGYKSTYIEYRRDGRYDGKTGYTLRKMIKFGVDGITAFSGSPLKFASVLGFAVSSIAFLIILYTLFSKFVLKQAVTGWASIMISSMFIGGVQLITIGIIGEYISRINQDVKDRPLYVVDEMHTFSNEE